MKKSIVYSFLCATTVLFGLSSCLEDVGNKRTFSGQLATVVASSETQKVVQLDIENNWGGYYYADEFLNSSQVGGVGSRILLSSLTINYDNQPVGATGTKEKPIQLSEIQGLSKVDVSNVIYPLPDEPELQNDSLEMFYTPLIAATSIERTYLTIHGNVLKNSVPKFRLIERETLSGSGEGAMDTLCFELQTTYQIVPETKDTYDFFVHSFVMPRLESEQMIKIQYASKRVNNQFGNFKDGYCLIEAPVINKK